MKELINKNVIVRGYYMANWAGTFSRFDAETQSIVLTNAYRLWKWKTDKGVCLSAVAKHGDGDGRGH
jgi:hypothetical protein